jgi:hypothetical protein
MLIHGVDFTSAPRRAKPITVATGQLDGRRFELQGIEALPTFAAFESWLARPGPWIAGFDFPFGLPRESVQAFGWPLSWPALARHCCDLGRDTFRSMLDTYRASRPVGAKYTYRRGDAAAGSHSPLKLVNPPVALMFLEGAVRLVDAGISVPGLMTGDPARIALEAYPGYAVRRLLGTRTRASYKNDAKVKQTVVQRALRKEILRRLRATASCFGFVLSGSRTLLDSLRNDGSGDRLDAVLCAMQAAWGWVRREQGYGLPDCVDPIEGWIVTVPAPAAV